MIRLFNIIINDNQISCDYEPELSGKSGHLSVSLLTQEVSNYRFSDYEYGKNFYLSHAYAKILDLINTGNQIPREAYSICF